MPIKWTVDQTAKKKHLDGVGSNGKKFAIDLVPKVNLYGVTVNGQILMDPIIPEGQTETKQLLIYYMKDAKAKAEEFDPAPVAPVVPVASATPVSTPPAATTAITTTPPVAKL